MSLKTFEPNLNMLSNGFINCQISLDVIKASSDVHMIILIFEFRNILGCINVGVGTECPKNKTKGPILKQLIYSITALIVGSLIVNIANLCW